MKITLIPVLAAAGLAAACATTDGSTQVARAECKVVPMTTASAAGVRRGTSSSLEQRDAEFQLATSDYRMRQLRERGLANNNVEEALRDCY